MSDHAHLLFGANPNDRVSDLVACLKRDTSSFINEKKFFKVKFQWQDGYGVFTYGRSQLYKIYNYILNQEKHHHRRTFHEEYIDLLKKFEIEHEEKYLLNFLICVKPLPSLRGIGEGTNFFLFLGKL